MDDESLSFAHCGKVVLERCGGYVGQWCHHFVVESFYSTGVSIKHGTVVELIWDIVEK